MSKRNYQKTELEKRLEAEAAERAAAAARSAVDEEQEKPIAEGAVEEVEDDGSDDESLTVVDTEAMEALRAERDDLNNQLLRARAEFDNYRKRVARDADRTRRTAAQSLVRDLLPVVDHLELAVQHAREQEQQTHEADPMLEGVEMVLRQFYEALGKNGVEPIPAVGELFDPNWHEAVSQMPSDDHPANTVAVEFQKGYRMGDQILRPAKVVVSTGPGPDAEDAAPEREPNEDK